MTKIDTPNSGSQAGFTLLEVALASVIMMVVGLGAASVFYYAVRLNSGGAGRRVATTLAQDVVERYRRATFGETVAPNPQTYNVTGSDGHSYSVSIDVAALSDTLKRVTVSVTPNSSPGQWATQPFSERLLKSKSAFGANYQPCSTNPC